MAEILWIIRIGPLDGVRGVELPRSLRYAELVHLRASPGTVNMGRRCGIAEIIAICGIGPPVCDHGVELPKP